MEIPTAIETMVTSSYASNVAEFKNQGDAFYSQDNYLAAIDCYSKGLALEPTNILLYHNRGLSYLKLLNFAELRSNCDTILQLDPSNIKALVNRSFAFNKLGLVTEAINDLRSAINLGADDPNLTERMMGLEQQQQQRTIEELKRQGNHLFQQQKYKEALGYYHQALLLDPQNVTLHNNCGLCFLNLGMFSELRANADTILVMDPTNIKALVNRAVAWEQQGFFSEAVQDLQVALGLNPRDRDVAQRLVKLAQRQVPRQSVTQLVSFPQNQEVIVLFADPKQGHSESSPLLNSIHSAHHSDLPVEPPMNKLMWFQLAGFLLSLGVLGFAIYQATQSYGQYQEAASAKGFRKLFAPYYFVQLVGAIIQSLNSAHGTFAFLFRSAKGLEIYGGASTATIVWQAIQTIIFIVFSSMKGKAPGDIGVMTILGVVVGWIPIIINILAVKLRFHLLTWNLLTQFTFLDGFLCAPTTPQHSDCIPHDLVPSSMGCCQKIYRCNKCGEVWKRT